MTSLYSHDIILVLFKWIIKQDCKKKIFSHWRLEPIYTKTEQVDLNLCCVHLCWRALFSQMAHLSDFPNCDRIMDGNVQQWINPEHAGKKISDDISKSFSYSSQKIGFDISCKLCLLTRVSAWNFKAFFLGKIRKISLICCLLNSPREW